MYEDYANQIVEVGSCDTEPDGCEGFISVAKSQYFELRCKAKYWHTQYLQAKVREQEMAAEIKELRQQKAPQLALQAKILKLQSQLESADGSAARGQLLKRLRKKVSKLQLCELQLRGQLQRALRTNEQLQADKDRSEAHVARLKGLVFGARSEKRATRLKCGSQASKAAARPGRQRHSKKSGKRRDYSDLPVRVERHEVAEQAARCSRCGQAFVYNGTEESELIEIQVEAYRRSIVRARKRRICQCEGVSQEVVAAPPQRLFARSRYGLSVWALYLHERFAQQRTVGGFCRFLSAFGLPVTGATLVNRSAAFLALFKQVYRAILQRISEAQVIYGDETGWPLHQGGIVNGESQRGWLWMNGCDEAVGMHIDRFRNADAALVLYGGFESHSQPVILVCDRYSVYPKLATQLSLALQSCWVHLRRDYITAAIGRDDLQDWSEQWVSRIGELYELNAKRLEDYDSQLPLAAQNDRFNAGHRQLEHSVEAFFTTAQSESESLSSDSAKYQPLNSALSNRAAFSMFVDHPECAMDNNFSERSLRPSVIARKLSLGSNSEVAAQLMSVMLSIFATLRLHHIREYDWLVDYLGACAANGGAPPADISAWLPWSMDQPRLEQFRCGNLRPQAP